ncbi:hypothetical protein [Amycolatopsis sp. DSM 110486]|uniref:hypothetical protein n=1 Tax=Amycolatopsis sp. DSM 110486 TaxID=2865832 RepID=UPI001C6A3D7E|nr:hypothetical protein [Amycolatopsis sp. DSM 110486]QYN23148.1 hypothetical protein K1T34_12220 [Amycolatopsis sp. DSM 110486]
MTEPTKPPEKVTLRWEDYVQRVDEANARGYAYGRQDQRWAARGVLIHSSDFANRAIADGIAVGDFDRLWAQMQREASAHLTDPTSEEC